MHRWTFRLPPYSPLHTDCTICKKGWYSTGVAFKCKKCTRDQRLWGIVIAAVSGFFAILCLVFMYSHLMSGDVVGVGRAILDRVIRYVPLQAVKILIVAWQIESQASTNIVASFVCQSRKKVTLLWKYPSLTLPSSMNPS